MATAASESIFDIFKKYKVPVNGILYPRHISASTQLWGKAQQERLEHDAITLASDGYIILDTEGYRLTQKGYDRIYQYHNLQDTIDIILGDFRKRRVGEDEMLSLKTLLSTLNNLDRYHFDNYSRAIKQLAEKGWLVYNNMGYILTREGYSEVYPD